MGSRCIRCDEWIGTTKPHACTGPEWLCGVTIPGFDNVVLHGFEPQVKKVLAVLAGLQPGDHNEGKATK